MRFSNQTPLPAAMVPSAGDDDRITAIFLAAVTYRIEAGRLDLAPEQRPLLVGPGRERLSYPHDAMLEKDAVSVTASGFVYPKQGKAREATAILGVGAVEIPILALGQRVWQRSAFSLAPTSPLPFDRVAMAWQNAYGGTTTEPARVVEVDGEEAFLPSHEGGYPFNFDGKGFYTDASQAVDQPLPQLEDPEKPVRRWDDRPDPVCFAPYPLWGGMRASHVMRDGQFDRAGVGKLACRSAPRTTFDTIAEGTRIALLGMRPGGGLLSFEVPRSPVAIDLSIGTRHDRMVPSLHAVDLDAEAAEVRLLFRASITYDLIQHELRRAEARIAQDLPAA